LERGNQMTKFALDLGFGGDRFRHMRAQTFAEAPTHAMQCNTKSLSVHANARGNLIHRFRIVRAPHLRS
jgi:hypothetical protein